MNTKIVTINLGPRSYDIYIGSDILYRIADKMPFDLAGRKVFILTDTNVEKYAHRVRDALAEMKPASTDILAMPPGEKTKSLRELERVTDWLLGHKASRDSVLFAVGGGVIGDLAGFCAAVTLRGIPFVQIPTTLLSQVDSSVGGKTGINTAQGKNLIGSFYQPSAVIADTSTLSTLPRRELLSGYAEIVKYGLINDAAFFTWLEEHGEAVCNLEQNALTHAIETSVKTKAAIVESDERESGKRALLNLGHTFGHALEAAAEYDGRLLHGEAVAMGILMAFDMSYRMGLCDAEDFTRIEKHFQKIGLLTRASYIQPTLNTSVNSLFEIMSHDKKVSGGTLKLVLTNGIGESFLTSNYKDELVKEALKQSLGGETSGNGDKQWIKKQWTSIFSSRS